MAAHLLLVHGSGPLAQVRPTNTSTVVSADIDAL
jgi:hypothetical protein